MYKKMDQDQLYLDGFKLDSMEKRLKFFALFSALLIGILSACAPNQTWQDAYTGFLREKVPTSEIDYGEFADGSEEQERFGAFLAGGYPVVPFFYLYDFNNDELPELIYIDAANGYDGEVYTYKSNSISKIGSIKFYPFGSLGILVDESEGVYSDIGYKGHYGEIYLYTIDNDILTEKMVIEYNNQSELSPSQAGLPYSFDNFVSINYYEVNEINIEKVIYGSQ